jgi:hypothetical protein
LSLWTFDLDGLLEKPTQGMKGAPPEYMLKEAVAFFVYFNFSL